MGISRHDHLARAVSHLQGRRKKGSPKGSRRESSDDFFFHQTHRRFIQLIPRVTSPILKKKKPRLNHRKLFPPSLSAEETEWKLRCVDPHFFSPIGGSPCLWKERWLPHTYLHASKTRTAKGRTLTYQKTPLQLHRVKKTDKKSVPQERKEKKRRHAAICEPRLA